MRIVSTQCGPPPAVLSGTGHCIELLCEHFECVHLVQHYFGNHVCTYHICAHLDDCLPHALSHQVWSYLYSCIVDNRQGSFPRCDLLFHVHCTFFAIEFFLTHFTPVQLFPAIYVWCFSMLITWSAHFYSLFQTDNIYTWRAVWFHHYYTPSS